MTQPDASFGLSYAWFKASVERALDDASVPAASRAQAASLFMELLGLAPGGTPPDNPQLEDFSVTGAAPQSLAYASLIVGESIAALAAVSRIVSFMQNDPAGHLNEAAQQLGGLVRQIDRIVHGVPPQTLPSAFSLAKMMLALSGDAAPGAGASPPAKLLAQAIAGADGTRTLDVSAGLGLLVMVLGAIIDRSFGTPSAGAATWLGAAALPPLVTDFPTFALPLGTGATPNVALALEKNGAGLPVNLRAGMNGALHLPAGAAGLAIDIAAAGLQAQLPLAGGKPTIVGNPSITVGISKNGSPAAIAIGPVDGASLRVGEIGVAITLASGNPSLSFFARDGHAEFTPDDGFLADVLQGAARVDFDIQAEMDAQGGLRLVNGSGMNVTLPVPSVPSGPFKITQIELGIEPEGGFNRLDGTLDAAFVVAAGPFKATIEGLGVSIDLQNLLTGSPSVAVGLKPPTGIGLEIDTGSVKGGGYLYINADTGEYDGVLDLKVVSIGVKAIAMLSTKSPVGWSLLLLIYGQFPPIQLSWGFTLTGVGGLIGVRHTLDVPALERGMSSGALDAILFPDDPVANAPQIINQLATLFPVLRDGFVIGPMLEIGWGTPSLVTVRLGLLIELSQITLVGQVIVQLPPLVDEKLALLHLQADILGNVQFDPLKISFQGDLRNSRVVVITLTGDFAFRLQAGSDATFIMSAGGFHPRFHDVPDDMPNPFERVGAGFDIGIVRVDFKGYFAVTSATVQAGSDLSIAADLGVAGIQGDFGFDAICYLEPRFYFEIDVHASLTVKVLSKDFAGISFDGSLAGPGRWHIAGTGTVELPIVPDIHVHVDEHWGSDENTPSVTENVAQLLAAEIAKPDNWAALPPADAQSYVSLAPVRGLSGVLAHPCATLEFRQKLVPLGQDLKHVGVATIEGPDHYVFDAITYDGAAGGGAAVGTLQDPFAAAQFFDVADNERLEGASFCWFDSGVSFAGQDYVFDEVVTETLDYEQACLTDHSKKLVTSLYIGNTGLGNWVLAHGAAARSVMRDPARVLPIEQTRFAVDPAPVVITDRDTGAATAMPVFNNYWQARDTIAATPALDKTQHQVAELFEVG